METVILVSVLSTLGLVAIVGTIVVMFKKLNNKVDVNEIENIYRELENISNDLNRRIDELNNISDAEDTKLSLDLNQRMDDMERDARSETSNIYSLIDSRYDKLYTYVSDIDNKLPKKK